MSKIPRAVVGAVLAVSAIVGPGWADPDADRRPTFTKGKFAVPINQEHIKEDWAARGYSTPKVAGPRVGAYLYRGVARVGAPGAWHPRG